MIEAYQMVSLSHWGMFKIIIGYASFDPIDGQWYEDYE